MTGIVNSTGAKSGIIGTTVGTPVTDLSTATFPAGHVIQTVTDSFNGAGASYYTASATAIELHDDLRFSIIPVAASSKIIISFASNKSHVNTVEAMYAIGHEVTASGGTATPSNLLSGIVTIGGDTDIFSFFIHTNFGLGRHDPLYLEVAHSPSYTLGQKIWYSILAYSSSTTNIYFTNNGDVRFKAIEIKG